MSGATADNDIGIAFSDPQAWPEPVDGAALLDQLRATIERHVVVPPHTPAAAALWIMHAWTLDAFSISPILLIRSPTKRCGKSTLLIVLRSLVPRPLIASSASTAVIFRAIEAYRPTFLLDEVDVWMKSNDELRGVLNGGHTRSTAQVFRCVGEQHEIRAFSTFCAKALAGIGRLVDTLEDRSIIVPMKRKLLDDRFEKLRSDRFEQATLDPRRKCLRWAKDNLEVLRSADPDMPATLNDRAADNWRPLIAIADVAGGDWPKAGREAALALSVESDEGTVPIQLLADVRLIFQQSQLDRIKSVKLVETLHLMEERSWHAYGKRGKPITPAQLARLLDAFDIKPKTIRIGPEEKDTSKGYQLEQFEDAFSRYLRK
jgi:putative DNA primase/helicase